jgi:hypothetical protein
MSTNRAGGFPVFATESTTGTTVTLDVFAGTVVGQRPLVCPTLLPFVVSAIVPRQGGSLGFHLPFAAQAFEAHEVEIKEAREVLPSAFAAVVAPESTLEASLFAIVLGVALHLPESRAELSSLAEMAVEL